MPRGPIQLPQADLTLRAQMEARAEHPETADKVFVMHHDRTWTYRQFREESARMGRFLLGRLGAIDDKRPGHVAMLLENHLELVSLYGGCGAAGLTLFGINTGLRGDTLAGVINHGRARVLVVDERLLVEVEKVRGHGGQVPLPSWVWKILGYEKNEKYPHGLYEEGKAKLYVSKGVGTSYVAFRFLRRPEIVVIHFTTEDSKEPGA